MEICITPEQYETNLNVEQVLPFNVYIVKNA